MSLFLVKTRPVQRLYDRVSEASAALVISSYSSSFGLASRLLAGPVRGRVRNIYALVRIADEIVDNPDLSLGVESRARMLGWLHEDVRHALRTGYSANLVVHAFARTAIACGITDAGVTTIAAETGSNIAPADLVSRITEELRKNEDALVATPEGALL